MDSTKDYAGIDFRDCYIYKALRKINFRLFNKVHYFRKTLFCRVFYWNKWQKWLIVSRRRDSKHFICQTLLFPRFIWKTFRESTFSGVKEGICFCEFTHISRNLLLTKISYLPNKAIFTWRSGFEENVKKTDFLHFRR